MISTNTNKGSLKEIRKREQAIEEAGIKELCEALAAERMGGQDKLVALSNQHKGLWYLPIMDEEGKIEKLLICKPIDRHILSYASTKMEDGGLYDFLECAMREVTIEPFSDMDIITDDNYFLTASARFNKIIDGKKAYFLKR